jgi:hypothetical protein
MTTLLLRAPSRRQDDISISLRAPADDPVIAGLMAEIALGASCPEEKAEQVRLCILGSGRYDCRVATCAVSTMNLEFMREALDEFGGSIEIFTDDGEPSTQHQERADGRLRRSGRETVDMMPNPERRRK